MDGDFMEVHLEIKFSGSQIQTVSLHGDPEFTKVVVKS